MQIAVDERHAAAIANSLHVMRQRDLVRGLITSLPPHARAVMYPDHPLLVRGPDVLANIGGDLVAYFVYSGRGQRPGSPSGYARTLLSRLALPDGATFVLVLNDEDAVVNSDTDLFDAIQVGISQRGKPRNHWESIGDRAASAVEGLRRFHMRRFASAWGTRGAGSGPRAFKSPPTSSIRDRTSRSLPIGFDLDSKSGHIYAPEPRRANRRNLTRWAAQLTATAVDVDYDQSLESLEETVSALRSHRAHLPIHYAPTESLAIGRVQDVYKPYRAAAFAGYQTNLILEG